MNALILERTGADGYFFAGPHLCHSRGSLYYLVVDVDRTVLAGCDMSKVLELPSDVRTEARAVLWVQERLGNPYKATIPRRKLDEAITVPGTAHELKTAGGVAVHDDNVLCLDNRSGDEILAIMEAHPGEPFVLDRDAARAVDERANCWRGQEQVRIIRDAWLLDLNKHRYSYDPKRVRRLKQQRASAKKRKDAGKGPKIRELKVSHLVAVYKALWFTIARSNLLVDLPWSARYLSEKDLVRNMVDLPNAIKAIRRLERVHRRLFGKVRVGTWLAERATYIKGRYLVYKEKSEYTDVDKKISNMIDRWLEEKPVKEGW